MSIMLQKIVIIWGIYEGSCLPAIAIGTNKFIVSLNLDLAL